MIANGYNYDGTLDEDKIAKSLCAKTNWELSDEAGTRSSARKQQQLWVYSPSVAAVTTTMVHSTTLESTAIGGVLPRAMNTTPTTGPCVTLPKTCSKLPQQGAWIFCSVGKGLIL